MPEWEAAGTIPVMFTMTDDQVVDAAMARALHQDALRHHALVAWIVYREHPAHIAHYIAQLAATGPLPYVLIGDTLAEVQEQLPPGLIRHPRQPGQAPEVVEMWVAA